MKTKTESKGPEFLQWFGPVLDALRELGGSAKPTAVNDLIARKHQLPPSVLEEKTKTGVPRFYNQVAWARQYLVNGGYLDSSKRGVWMLTEKGKQTTLNLEQAHAIFASVQESFKTPFVVPLIQALRQLGGSGKPRDISDLMAQNLDLPASVIDAKVKDGSPRFHNQVAWARKYLAETGYIDPDSHGVWVLTDKGRNEDLPPEDSRTSIISEFQAWQNRRKKHTEDTTTTKEVTAMSLESQETDLTLAPSSQIANTDQEPDANAEVAEGSEEGDLEATSNKEGVVIEKNDRSLSELQRWYKAGRLIIDPEWQRNYVWDRKRASKLVESFLVDIPVPIVYLAKNESNNYEVIDGVQRLTSIFNFFDNEFALSGIEVLAPLKGKKYRDLSPELQNKLQDTTLRTFELSPRTGLAPN